MAHPKRVKLGVISNIFFFLQLLSEGDRNAGLIETSSANDSHQWHLSNRQKQKNIVLYFRISRKETIHSHH